MEDEAMTPAAWEGVGAAATAAPAEDDAAGSMPAVAELRADVQRLLETQAAVLKAPSAEGVSALAAAAGAVRERCAGLLGGVGAMWRTTLLAPADIDLARALVQDLSCAQRQIDVLSAEFAAAQANAPPAQAAALAVARQPFPLVLRKGEQLSGGDAVVVRLLPAAGAALTVASQVRVQIVSDSHQVSRSVATHELLEPLAVPLDPATLCATFPFRFVDGTKNTPVALRFSVQIAAGAGGVATFVESETTAPLVVTTHKDQWRGAAGAMLRREAFLGQQFQQQQQQQQQAPAAQWEQVANTLQAHFLRATKQHATGARRALSPFDLAYVAKKFFGGAPSVQPAVFDVFWGWFGATVDTLRHQRPILGLWLQGLVYGFASKEDVDVALAGQPPGTFLVRFSESSPGSFAIAYASPEGGPKHYLVTPQDHALHKTLPDFIVSQPQFGDVLQLQASRDDPTLLQLVRVNKFAAYEPFCTKKISPSRPPVPGYSDLAH